MDFAFCPTMEKSVVTPGQAPKLIFPTPKIHFSYNKYCFRMFDSSVAMSREERRSRAFTHTVFSLGDTRVPTAGDEGRGANSHGCGAAACEAKPVRPSPRRGTLTGTLRETA